MAEPMSLLERWIVAWQRELLNRRRAGVAPFANRALMQSACPPWSATALCRRCI